uniref:NADH-ubiquinone oxidoreductase chain 5 n=1 Tax=Pectinatella magnifica TaxID=350071 RepID=A0A344AUX0_9BILA|nr:NADH dehydrogenase subunit 5 [Pectinatella magnifica]AWX65967.1 NADH dehydrogenase subunit 5 [Pectinatella magnifica]
MMSTVMMTYNLIFIMEMDQTFLIEWSLSSINSTSFAIPLILDKTSCVVSMTVLIISSSVLWFTSSYLNGDTNLDRFTLLVVLFVLAMNCLVFIPNLMTLLLGWDGLGVTSFVLVIYYQNPKSLAAGMITALSNRVGDALLIVSIAFLLSEGDWSILSLQWSSLDNIVGIAIVAAAMTKSAQMPFSSWLPAAMAAPTPVSALVHSSTLVTAGVFLLIRFHPSLSVSSWFNSTLLIIGVMTSLMAGTTACLETDLKKIIALSTLSQLGVMMMSLGLNLNGFALFHLLTHALFKALLFLCAGTVIHSQQNNQDIRLMGNLSNQLPLTSGVLNMANMALCGFPFLGGFYSKDVVLEATSNNLVSGILLGLMWLSIALTTLYSTRLSLITLWGPNKGAPFTNIHEEEKPLLFPMFTLSVGAVVGGALFFWVLSPTLFSENLPLTMKTLPLTLMVISFYITMTMENPSKLCSLNIPPYLRQSISTMWFLSPLSSTPLIKGTFSGAKMVQQIGEGGWQEVVGGQGVFHLVKNLISTTQHSQKNPVSVFLSLIGLSMIFMILIW